MLDAHDAYRVAQEQLALLEPVVGPDARVALAADSTNLSNIIALGVAPAGASQMREAIATFTQAIELRPGGGGKIPVTPDYVVSREPGKITLRNYKNEQYEYVDRS